MKIGVVCALFNRPVTEKLELGAIEFLQEQNVPFELVQVPGAFEIPLVAKTMLQGNFDGVVALGAVIRGETSHYDFVCNAVERGCSELQLEFLKPIGFGVITTENSAQAEARAGGAKGNKGAEAAETTLKMIEILKQLELKK